MADIAEMKEHSDICDTIRKEMKVESWVYISIAYNTNRDEKIVLHHYDLPRSVYERYGWVITWRTAKCQCQHPRQHIRSYHSYYNKKIGRGVEINELQSRIIAAKAQVTKVKNKVAKYVQFQKENDMFFDETTDIGLFKVREKLSVKENNLLTLCERMTEMVNNLKL